MFFFCVFGGLGFLGGIGGTVWLFVGLGFVFLEGCVVCCCCCCCFRGARCSSDGRIDISCSSQCSTTGRGMCYPDCRMVHIRYLLLLIEE